MTADFVQKLKHLQAERNSNLVLHIAPSLERMPLPMQTYDEPFLPFSKAVIAASRPYVCAYLFDLAAYLSLGAAGAIALERAVHYGRADAITILHGPFYGAGYSSVLDERSFGVDAVTICDLQSLNAYCIRPDRSAFLVRPGQPIGEPATDTFTHKAGVFWEDAGLFHIPDQFRSVITLRITDKNILFRGMQGDFVERLQHTLKDMLHDS